MSNARVLVKKRTDDDGFYSSWQWNCSANHRCDQEPATTVWSQWHLNRAAAYAAAELHARSCPALSLARLREEITDVVLTLGRYAGDSMRYAAETGSDFDAGTSVGYGAAFIILTESTGITT